MFTSSVDCSTSYYLFANAIAILAFLLFLRLTANRPIIQANSGFFAIVLPILWTGNFFPLLLRNDELLNTTMYHPISTAVGLFSVIMLLWYFLTHIRSGKWEKAWWM